MNAHATILKGILSVVEHISNAQFQQRAWIEKAEHPYAFFEESMHQLFDDYEISEVLNNYELYGISDEQYKILQKFYKTLDQYSDEKMSWLHSVDPKEVLEDPRWHAIQKMAQEVLKAFHFPHLKRNTR